MSAPTIQPKVAVVIATCNRFQLLTERSLPSVISQTRSPDYLIVVDDSQPGVRPGNAESVQSVVLSGCEVFYFENQRTKGASGAWNTAIDYLMNKGTPGAVFVAILDDDDSWCPEYLESCYSAACDRQLDMVASDLRRLESVGAPPFIVKAPDHLCSNDFLTSNPGIQGSNLYVRLSTLLAAGGFDEALQSTTDRDLCIRISDLSTARYGRLYTPLVNHYADSNRLRLSTRGSQAKISGVTAFWRKYFGRMTIDQRVAFSDRAAALFNWRPPTDQAITISSTIPAPVLGRFSDNAHLVTEQQSSLRSVSGSIENTPPHQPFQLYVGVISSDPMMLNPLLKTLALLADDDFQKLAVLVLDNGSPKAEFNEVIRRARGDGLLVAVVDEAQQHKDAESGSFGAAFRGRPCGQVGIARARTMLQRYLGALLAADQDSIAWILDDDMLVDDRARSYLPWLPEFRKHGADVLIGAQEWSSPNPPLNGIRVHLVDLLHNLHWLRSLPHDAILPDRAEENVNLRSQYPDYYYDLSRKHTAHLEMPHWLEPAFPGETVRDAYCRLLNGAIGILNGKPLTRPIVATVPLNPLLSAKDTVNRGGCTFILNHRALSQTPNTITYIQGREARRSDMVWAIVNRHYRQMNIKAVSFPVKHVGRVNTIPSLNVEKVQGEIIGSTLYAGLKEFLASKPQHELDFSSEELDEVCRLADRHLDRRWRMMEQSFYRIAGLREAIRSQARPGEFQDLIRNLDEWFTPEKLDFIRSGIETHEESEVRVFLGSLRAVADDFAVASVDLKFIRTQLKETVRS